MHLPKLPVNAAYIRLSNPQRRNALSFAVLQDLKAQLVHALTSPSGKLRILPPCNSKTLTNLENATSGPNSDTEDWKHYGWLVNASEWARERAGLPDVLVLRSEGPVFSSGHDLKELTQLRPDEVKSLFSLCAEVMTLIRRSPALVVCPIQGLATAAGFQVAMATDYPIALSNTTVCLPGARIGLPCTSPSTAISRRLPPAMTYRLLATAQPVTAADIPGAIDVVWNLNHNQTTYQASAAFEKRVADVVQNLVSMSAQQQAVGKWAYWTQLGISSSDGHEDGDGFESAAQWAGRVMAMHAKSGDAKEGIDAFLQKRPPAWISRET
ncbi:Fc.00g000010.m01.CDS01 [Cosmosporella sp. VM-42]